MKTKGFAAGTQRRGGRKKTGAWIAGIGAGYLAVLAAVASSYGWNASCFLHVGEANSPAERADLPAGLVVHADRGGYDGLHYYQVARDPFRRDLQTAAEFKTEHFLTRYQRIGFPVLGWAAALGRERRIPAAMLALNLSAILAGAWAFLRLGSVPGALALASAPAMSLGLAYGLTEPMSLAFCAWAALAFRRDCAPGAALALAAACLTRETSALFAGAFALDATLRRRWKEAALFVASTLPAALYAAWLRRDLGAPSASAFTDGLGIPFLGFARQFHRDLSPGGGALASAVGVWWLFAWCALAGHFAARAVSTGAPWRAFSIAVFLHSAVMLVSYQEAWATLVNAGRLAGGLSLSLVALATSGDSPAWSRLLAIGALPIHLAALARILADRGLPYTLS